MKTALFIGRFQPFHLGHMSVIKRALKENDFLIISIGSSNKSHTLQNPFSIEERVSMIKKALFEENIVKFQLIVDEDVGDDEEWMNNIKENYPNFDVLYTGNSIVKKLFLKHGFKVKDIEYIKGLTSTKIREAIQNNEDWKKYVPEAVYNYLVKENLTDRIKNLDNYS